MIIEREYLSGSYISQTEDTPAMASSDVFLISEPFVDKKDCKQFFSKKLDYETLSNHLLADIIKGLDLDSMAWELSDDYARYGHVHDYSKVEVSSFFGKENNNTRLVDIVVNGDYNSIYMQYVKIPVQDKPDIGQLKFKSKLGEKSIDSADFDGWIYPDGRYLSKTRFSKAFSVFGIKYGESADQTQFAIPKLDHFIKANPCLTTTGLENYVNFHNGVGVHQHSIKKMNTTKELSSTLSVSVTSGNSKGIYSHGGRYSSGIIGNVTTSLQFRIEDVGLTNFSTEPLNNNIESYPKYNVIPVLMYVGGEA